MIKQAEKKKGNWKPRWIAFSWLQSWNPHKTFEVIFWGSAPRCPVPQIHWTSFSFHLCWCEMARLILSGIEEIKCQRMGTNPGHQFPVQDFFPAPPSMEVSSSSWQHLPRTRSTGQGHHARGGTGCTVIGLKSLASCCICQWLNTGSWTRHSTGYFKLALSLCAFERGIMRTNVGGVFQWWTPVHDVRLSTNSHQLTTSHCCDSRCLCFLRFRQKPYVSWLMMLIFNN